MIGETNQYSKYMIRLARYCHCSAQLTCQSLWKILNIMTPYAIASYSLAKQHLHLRAAQVSPFKRRNLIDKNMHRLNGDCFGWKSIALATVALGTYLL